LVGVVDGVEMRFVFVYDFSRAYDASIYRLISTVQFMKVEEQFKGHCVKEQFRDLEITAYRTYCYILEIQ
jgi:hypothetical protein